ncbi:MAG: sulfatase-like hydrolase/transferase [Phycisphaerales bacterium]|jgi:membrane-anchored protein YejM (alkaline phosphatase superfamily)|nr:sulfatase-like hydrolase/transferase [Phycisphaerales bacterium]MBT7171097.1 sulfatase-like hydrolase/transferase [Phycisphaerales bacterium]
MPRANLVLFHLESLSTLLFDQFGESLPCIRALSEQSLWFTNAYAAATSTHMSQASVLYGSDHQLDHIRTYDQTNVRVMDPDKHLFTKLESEGYSVLGIGYPDVYKKDDDLFHDRKIWNEERCGRLSYENQYETFEKKTEAFLRDAAQRDQNFALYVHPLISHLSYKDESKLQTALSHDRMKYGYVTMDTMFAFVMATLESLGLDDSTAIVLFGDHGDDFYFRGFNNGMCHAVEPYANQVKVPLFIKAPAQPPGATDVLTSTNDIYNLTLSLLDSDREITLPRNEFVFSQNLFFNQTPSAILNKSFMASDGTHSLIVSALGMELYDCRIDPYNLNNLLSFVTLTAEGLVLKGKFKTAHVHFQNFFTERDVAELNTTFQALRDALRAHLMGKKQRVLEIVPCTISIDSYFKTIRPRTYYWRYPLPWRMKIPAMIQRSKGAFRRMLPGFVIRALRKCRGK